STGRFILLVCSVLSMPPTRQRQKNITAILGQNIVLPCRAADSKPVIVLDWTRSNPGLQGVFLFRDNTDFDNQHEQFKNRVELQDRQMKNGDVSLVLKNVTAADRGTYKCRIIQRGIVSAATPICIINLDFIKSRKSIVSDCLDQSFQQFPLLFTLLLNSFLEFVNTMRLIAINRD
uniref:Ig-like domain-containing protein n=1 Tax=Fundulus heteroclitus TaxID=8078 RepID=A0A3Q2PVP8_FUNHE